MFGATSQSGSRTERRFEFSVLLTRRNPWPNRYRRPTHSSMRRSGRSQQRPSVRRQRWRETWNGFLPTTALACRLVALHGLEQVGCQVPTVWFEKPDCDYIPRTRYSWDGVPVNSDEGDFYRPVFRRSRWRRVLRRQRRPRNPSASDSGPVECPGWTDHQRGDRRGDACSPRPGVVDATARGHSVVELSKANRSSPHRVSTPCRDSLGQGWNAASPTPSHPGRNGRIRRRQGERRS